MTGGGESVKVTVRARPMNKKEEDNGSQRCITIDKSVNQVIIARPGEGKDKEKPFTYDSVYDWDSTQREVYDESAFPLVESVIKGYNGTIFAYGQTGCGKTHTMMGLKGVPEQEGVIPNAFQHIFGCIDSKDSDTEFLVRCSYLEIYNEEVRDLLAKDTEKKLDVKEDKDKTVYIKDLTCTIVNSIPQIEQLMNKGNNARKVGETAMNKGSSRSHSIFSIYVETSEDDGQGKGEKRIKCGKLNLVDLAGSERQSKTQAEGLRLKEAIKINQSLVSLGNVISALVDGKQSFIPYRDSKLTRLLQDSLGGNTKTVMVAAISPADYNYEETLSTLRYAARAKSIKNKPRINEDPKDAMLKQYQEEISRLKALLEASQNGANIPQQINDQFTQSLKQNKQQIMLGAEKEGGEETVDDLLAKLAKKGKKVQLVDESPNIKTPNKANNLKKDTLNSPSTNSNQAIVNQKQQANDTGPQRTITNGATQANNIVQEQESDEQREKLQDLINDMEMRLVKGGQAIQEQEKEQTQQRRMLQLKLKKERRIQEKLLEEKNQQEEELLEKDRQYETLQEEVEQQRQIIKKLRTKYKQVANELRDIENDKEHDKLDYVNTIRDQQREVDFQATVLKMMLKDGEMYKIKESTQYDESRDKWIVPPFILKNKEVALPKIKNAGEFVKEQLENRDLIFENNHQHESFGGNDPHSTMSNNSGIKKVGNTNQKDFFSSQQSDGFQKHKTKSRFNYPQSVDVDNTNQSHLSNGQPPMAPKGAKKFLNRNESENNNFGKTRTKYNIKTDNMQYVLPNESPDQTVRHGNKKSNVQLAPLDSARLPATNQNMLQTPNMQSALNTIDTNHPIEKQSVIGKKKLKTLEHTGLLANRQSAPPLLSNENDSLQYDKMPSTTKKALAPLQGVSPISKNELSNLKTPTGANNFVLKKHNQLAQLN